MKNPTVSEKSMAGKQVAQKATQTDSVAYEPTAITSNFGSLRSRIARLNKSGDFPDDASEALTLFLDWVAACDIDLWPHQSEALADIAVGDHVILGTPTGSGKSLVALGMHFMALCTKKRSYYTAPIKALVNEKFFSLVDAFGRENIGMMTGDVCINAQAPIICCTEEVLANHALRGGENADIGCVVMDEFHYFGDRDRGWAWQVPLLALPQVQFLLMSATLGNMDDIAASLEKRTGRTVDVITDATRPVPLTFRYEVSSLTDAVIMALHEDKAPMYLVHFSQDAAFDSAQLLSGYDMITKKQRAVIKETIADTDFSTRFGHSLKGLLECGVGVHHAGMLPRYRRLVERLAQRGLLPVICGTDTLGLGINVPIRTVIFTALVKFDGSDMRHLTAREFHQIAGRAGRAGFDTEGLVLALAPPHEVRYARARAKAGGNRKKQRRVKKKRLNDDFVDWDRTTFEYLLNAVPETLEAHMRMTHSMVLSIAARGGDAWSRTRALIEDSAQNAGEKAILLQRASEIFDTLTEAGIIEKRRSDNDAFDYALTVDFPVDFALDQPLSPFLLSMLDLLDPESTTYAQDVISLVEATLEDPRQVLRAQEYKVRQKAIVQMKLDYVSYDERLERAKKVTYPKPLDEFIGFAFKQYCQKVPWARDFEPRPKSILREMVETASDFNDYVSFLDIMRSEGTLLRYLSEAYRVLVRTVPVEARDERLNEVIDWLNFTLNSIDSSLLDEWKRADVAFNA